MTRNIVATGAAEQEETLTPGWKPPPDMATRPPRHRLPKIAAPSHAREVYDKQTRQRSHSLKSAADVRSSSFWKKVRLTYLSRHPVCENPHGFHDQFPPPAREVHHKQSLAEAPELAFRHDNLMALCSKCHARFSAEERS